MAGSGFDASVSNTILRSATGLLNITFYNDTKDKDSADTNALNNASGAANTGKETATLTLRGYPLLKAKTTLEITGVGKGSGVWYCKTVLQQWHVEHGYLTNAQLTKGEGGGSGSGSGGGEGGGGGSAPINNPRPRS